MKIKFLGTAAAEGVPAAFCQCKTCTNARIFGGKNVRKRTAVLIDDTLLIDVGPDVWKAFEEYQLDYFKLKYIVVTHDHFDHFYPENLEVRTSRYVKQKTRTLKLVGNAAVMLKLDQLGYSEKEIYVQKTDSYHYKEIRLGSYDVIPIIANHAHEHGSAYNYIVVSKKKKLLYATDTGIYTNEQLHRIAGHKVDALVIDSTNLLSTTSTNHLNFDGVMEMIEKMKKYNVLNENAKIVSTHFSHTGIGDHDALCEYLDKVGIITSYDGLEFEI